MSDYFRQRVFRKGVGLIDPKEFIRSQEFARKVIFGLGLAENTDNYFKEQNEYAEEDLIFTLSDEEFNQVKQSIENSL